MGSYNFRENDEVIIYFDNGGRKLDKIKSITPTGRINLVGSNDRFRQGNGIEIAHDTYHFDRIVPATPEEKHKLHIAYVRSKLKQIDWDFQSEENVEFIWKYLKEHKE